MTEQAVTDKPDDAALQASEATGEQDDMNALLASYDEPLNEPAAEKDDTRQAIAELRQDMQQRQREDIDRDYHAAANSVAEKLDLPYDDATKQRIARGLLLEKIEGDPRVMKAFTNRASDSKTWDAVLANVAETISGGKIDRQATTSRNAMRTSMTRGSTETEPDDDNGKAEAKRVRGLSDTDLYREVGLID